MLVVSLLLTCWVSQVLCRPVCPEHSTFKDGKCRCKFGTITFNINGQLVCKLCPENCSNGTVPSYKCNNLKAYHDMKEVTCKKCPKDHFAFQGTCKVCEEQCAKKINERQIQDCGLTHNRICKCKRGFYRSTSSDSCIMDCSKCTSEKSQRLPDGFCSDMPVDMRCTSTGSRGELATTTSSPTTSAPTVKQPTTQTSGDPSSTTPQTQTKVKEITVKNGNVTHEMNHSNSANSSSSTTHTPTTHNQKYTAPPEAKEDTKTSLLKKILSVVIAISVLMFVGFSIKLSIHWCRNRHLFIPASTIPTLPDMGGFSIVDENNDTVILTEAFVGAGSPLLLYQRARDSGIHSVSDQNSPGPNRPNTNTFPTDESEDLSEDTNEIAECDQSNDDVPISQSLLHTVADGIGGDWRKVGRKLQIEEYHLEQIDLNYKETYEKAAQMISQWRKNSETPPVWKDLKKTLMQLERWDIIRTMENQISEDTNECSLCGQIGIAEDLKEAEPLLSNTTSSSNTLSEVCTPPDSPAQFSTSDL